jgi:Tfp pilus assembly protein PilE
VARHRNVDEGWTLLELMVIVLILGILVAIAVASYSLAADRARRVTCRANQRALNTAVMVYEQEHDAAVPPDLGSLRPYVANDGFTRCPSDVDYSYDATSGLIACPIHPPQ